MSRRWVRLARPHPMSVLIYSMHALTFFFGRVKLLVGDMVLTFEYMDNILNENY